MQILRWVGAALGLGLVVLLVLIWSARGGDGPSGFFPGGELVAGELVDAPAGDWNFAADVGTIELQLVEPVGSRTVWIVVHEGAAYIPCGVPHFRLWKQWPHDAVTDGRAVLRIEGKRYPVTLVKIDDEPVRATVSRLVAQKYGVGGDETPGQDSVWFFRIDPRSA